MGKHRKGNGGKRSKWTNRDIPGMVYIDVYTTRYIFTYLLQNIYEKRRMAEKNILTLQEYV